MAKFYMDYINEAVGSRIINGLVLIAACGPLLHWTYVIQRELNVHYPPIFYMLSWGFFPLISCIFILVPLQIGNNYFSTNNYCIYISIIWCIILFGYELASIIVLIHCAVPTTCRTCTAPPSFPLTPCRSSGSKK